MDQANDRTAGPLVSTWAVTVNAVPGMPESRSLVIETRNAGTPVVRSVGGVGSGPLPLPLPPGVGGEQLEPLDMTTVAQMNDSNKNGRAKTCVPRRWLIS